MKNFLKQIFFALIIISYAPTIVCAYLPKAEAGDNLSKHGLEHPVIVSGTSMKHGCANYRLTIGPNDDAQSVKEEIARQLEVDINDLTQSGGQEVTAKSIAEDIRDREKRQKRRGGREIMAAYSLVD